MVDIKCLEKALEAAGKEFSPKEMQALLEQFERRIQRKMAKRNGTRETLDAKVLDEAKALAEEVKFEAFVAKRQEIINIFAGRYRDDIFAALPGRPDVALTAMNVGTNRAIKGGRASVDTRQKEMAANFLGTAMSEMRKAGVLDFFRNADEPFERLIGREMEQLNLSDGKPGITKNAEALKIAQVLNKVTESARVLQNDAGAYIAKRNGFVASQSHDMAKMYRAGYEKWRDYIYPRLAEFTFNLVENEEDFMRATYNELVNGRHHMVDGDQAPPAGVELYGNRAAKASEARVLHFKSFDDWYDYNQNFGSGTLREATINGWQKAAKNIGIMQVWGTNPKDAFMRTVKQLQDKNVGNKKVYDKLKDQALINQFDQIDGTASIPGNITLAEIGAGTRAVNTMAKLGGSTVSSIVDPATMGAEMRYQTGSFLKGHALAIEARLTAVPESLRAETTDLMGVGVDGLLGNIIHRWDAGDGTIGMLSKATNLFFKLNLQTWWDDSGRRGFGMVMARELAQKSKLAYSAIGEDLSRVLQLYDIGQKEWDLVRRYTKTAEDGREYITPDIAREIPDSEIIAYRSGDKLTAGQIRRTRQELEQKLRMYFIDRSEYAILRPGARERAIMYQGLKPGTPMGEVARLFWQFKSYSVAFLTKAWGREIYGRGTPSVTGAIANIAPMILTTTALGYLAMSLKDMLKGKTPRPVDDFATWTAAMTQGGGLGIYGDFMFGNYNRFGTSFWATVLGPTAGNVEDVAKLWAAARNGDDTAAKSLRLIQNNLPFANLFYLRPALDYMLLYDLQEAVSPGSVRRLERKIKKENDQQFFMPPSEERMKPFTG